MTQFASLFRKFSNSRWTATSTDEAVEDEVVHDTKQPARTRSAPSPFSKPKTVSAAEADIQQHDANMQDVAPYTVPKPKNRIPNKPTYYKSSSKALNNLSIPCPDPTREERIRDGHQNRALRLVRQEDWDKLIKLITVADRDRNMTPGGMSVAELMAFGARADVVLAIEHALLDRVPEKDAPMLRGIEALEYVLAEYPDCYVIGCIVAQAHIDIAWSWRGIGWDVEISPRNREAFEAHFARARDIVTHFNGVPAESALLASTACALLRGDQYNTESVADRYEALIDLNPANTGPLRALGTHMLPRWYGSYAALELEARRTAARTQEIWGAGGYTWVMFDAISVDDEACSRLDLQYFIEGLRDIVSRRPEPHTVNLLAAYCANTMGQAFSGNDAADHIRAQIAGCADWLVREHLTELHPMIWAHAAQGFANNLRVSSASRFAAAGQDDALRIIASMFKREIAEGKRIVFTDEGPVATAT
ncbi:hypothetical protein [uncultured Sulfitobacter sp.]|uniref:hypothetical protein n=1 Tax=uncultured Sulfitobacter sp. TaxID=191468 RepID=UPI00262000B2|nr:hypothetical protein [uncultured Sulfitobacter sp.]